MTKVSEQPDDVHELKFFKPIPTEVLKDLETISKIDSYEKLNDVRFEGFSPEERRQQQQLRHGMINKATKCTLIRSPPSVLTSSTLQVSLLDSPVDVPTVGEVPVGSLLSVEVQQEQIEEEDQIVVKRFLLFLKKFFLYHKF